jgi:hypothetical protein
MRRRLWWQMCVLDRQATNDRGTDPIITANGFNTQLPLNVNDRDLIPDNPDEVQERDEYTDVTLSIICNELFDLERRLNYVPAGEFESPEVATDDPWAQRRGWVIAGQRRVEERYLRHCNMAIPEQRYTLLVARIIIATMWLFAYRPMQRHANSAISVKIPHPGILHLSVEVLEKASQVSLDPCANPFRWIVTIWVQWHALAVMIAELCVQTEGPTVERAWSIANAAFEETGRYIADSNKGRLWRPIRKLMSRAQEVRKKHLEDVAIALATVHNEETLGLASQTVQWPTSQPRLNETRTDSELRGLPDINGTMQQLPQNATTGEPISYNWDPWLATGPPNQMDYNMELNEMAWTNWETFIDDYQADGEFLPAQNAVPPGFNMW